VEGAQVRPLRCPASQASQVPSKSGPSGAQQVRPLRCPASQASQVPSKAVQLLYRACMGGGVCSV
jgi:hypothetical protein